MTEDRDRMDSAQYWSLLEEVARGTGGGGKRVGIGIVALVILVLVGLWWGNIWFGPDKDAVNVCKSYWREELEESFGSDANVQFFGQDRVEAIPDDEYGGAVLKRWWVRIQASWFSPLMGDRVAKVLDCTVGYSERWGEWRVRGSVLGDARP